MAGLESQSVETTGLDPAVQGIGGIERQAGVKRNSMPLRCNALV
jgi:hypothetical protein